MTVLVAVSVDYEQVLLRTDNEAGIHQRFAAPAPPSIGMATPFR